MTTYYNHKKIEGKWQQKWEQQPLNQAVDFSKNFKKYVLDMFPYPSGEGLHVGHPEGYTATDIYSRYLRMNGFNVLHPIGWDAFGLPAENYAIQQKVHPQKSTKKNIEYFRQQIKSLGFSYDWSREINTSDPDYYCWTQWLFLQLYKKDLAYKKKAPVNWCKDCKTVLANEQVIDGKCERCNHQVIQKDLEQWFFKITAYAEELLKEIDKLDWSQALKNAQKNWIGRSEGALIKFQVSNSKRIIEVFTTRPDTLFGATYMVLAPEHQLIQELKEKITNWPEVEKYIKQARNKNQMERTDLAKEKTGVELKGIKAINPATKKEIPIWLADYVLTSYGTGAIMAVPAHDQRDWEFADKYHLNKKVVVYNPNYIKDEYIENGGFLPQAMEEEGEVINSNGCGDFAMDGWPTEKAIKEVISILERKKLGKAQTQYKIRDWLVSRQRYWGAPIPIIYCDKCGVVPVPEKDLPVLLPDDVDFKPTGESPLVRSKKFHQVKCPKCGSAARRESDTMDTFVCSAWYFLRFCDPQNSKEIFNQKKIKYWLPVNLYVGGMEHAVGHLIYARFITKALRDAGFLNFSEPFLKIRNQGIILAEDGRKMSKRWKNVINPDKVVEEYGADTMRMYEMFMGPLEDHKPWDSKNIMGIRRFLEKVYKLINFFKSPSSSADEKTERLLNKTIKKVTADIEELKFNTAISAMMELVNYFTSPQQKLTAKQLETLVKLLAPFAPHLAEELWQKLGHKRSIFKESWPKFDPKLVIDEKVTVVIQVNGKLRATIQVKRGVGEKELKELVNKQAQIKKHLKGKEIKKFIYIKDKLVNLVI
ncbi:leucine--tRNA ligase [Patescibacteria group bacterium]|nr:leucine--tRNA ligase [Patescibacteria group bacterium]